MHEYKVPLETTGIRISWIWSYRHVLVQVLGTEFWSSARAACTHNPLSRLSSHYDFFLETFGWYNGLSASRVRKIYMNVLSSH